MEQFDLNKSVKSTENIQDSFLAAVRVKWVKWVWIGLGVAFTADIKLKIKKMSG